MDGEEGLIKKNKKSTDQITGAGGGGGGVEEREKNSDLYSPGGSVDQSDHIHKQGKDRAVENGRKRVMSARKSGELGGGGTKVRFSSKLSSVQHVRGTNRGDGEDKSKKGKRGGAKSGRK